MKQPERSVEELAKEIAMFPDDDILPEDMLIDYDRVKVGDIHKLLQAERQRCEEMVEKIVEDLKKEIPTYLNKRGHHTNSAHRKIKYNQALNDVKEALQALTKPNNLLEETAKDHIKKQLVWKERKL